MTGTLNQVDRIAYANELKVSLFDDNFKMNENWL